jgi:Flp pilus assembly protein TadG
VIVIARTRCDQATVIRIRFRRIRLERGAAAVEMAIVMPLLVAMIIGIIDFSRIFNAELQLSQAAREGVRMAALGFPTTDVMTRAQAAAPNPAWGAALPTGNVTVSPTCAPAPAPTDTAAVTVNYTFNGIMWMNGKILTQTAVMRCGG